MNNSTKIRAQRLFVPFLLTCVFLFSFDHALAQEDKGNEGRGRKEQLEKQEEKKEASKEAQEEAKEKHREMQSKRTKKDMRRLKRRSNRWNKGKREFFLVRWYKRIRYELRKDGGP